MLSQIELAEKGFLFFCQFILEIVRRFYWSLENEMTERKNTMKSFKRNKSKYSIPTPFLLSPVTSTTNEPNWMAILSENHWL